MLVLTSLRAALVRQPAALAEAASLNEGFVARGRREAWGRMQSKPFVIAEILGSAVVGLTSKPVLGLLYALGLLVAVAVWALAATPVIQRNEAREADAALAARQELSPRLAFGQAEIPERVQALSLPHPNGSSRSLPHGRVIRVPVTNVLGSRDALRAQVRLRFPVGIGVDVLQPHETQAEWFGQLTGPEVEVDLAGNGLPRLIDVVVVLDKPWPYAYEWTTQSRSAGLDGYGIQASPFDVQITVSGVDRDGGGVQIVDTLRIDCREGDAIVADWASSGDHVPTNLVPWRLRRRDATHVPD